MKKMKLNLQRFAGNDFLTPMHVAREALMVLKNNTVMSQLVSRDYDGEFAEVGDTVMVRRPANFEVDLFDPATGIKIQNAVEGKVSVVLDSILDVSFGITSKELSLSISDFSKQLIEPAVTSIEQAIDEKICRCYEDIPYFVGTPGNTPASVAAITAVRKEMNDNKVPMAGRMAVLDTAADAKLLELDAFNSVTVQFYPAARQTFAANTVVTVVKDHTASMAFHKNTFTLVTRPLAKPLGVADSQYAIISDGGISIRVVFDYDVKLKRDICSLDLLCGVKTMIPELACRILG